MRISFTTDETQEFARRVFAFQRFLRAGAPKWARNVPGIDADIAADADSYSGSLNGQHLPVPYGRESTLFSLGRAVSALTPTIRSFNSREKSLQPWMITREDDVRDLLFVMLKSSIFDLTKEEPTPSVAGTYKFVDLCSKASRILIEIKWIGKKGLWKKILDQIQNDIQCYPAHASCQSLIFVVVDAARDIRDPRLMERELTCKQVIFEKQVDIRLYVVEP